MKKTSMRKIVWSLLQKGEETSVNKLHEETKYNIVRISNYIRALYNAEYLEAKTTHTKIFHHHKIKLIKDTGKEAPMLYRGVLTDFNTLEEIVVFKHEGEDYSFRRPKNLIPIVEAIVKLGEREIAGREIVSKANVIAPALKRWNKQLIECKVLADTGARDIKNSPIYKVDLDRAERLLSFLRKYRNHKLAFIKLKKT